jgi:hypothetical protein
VTVVAVVPALDRADSIGATVGALLALGEVDGVVVVDDGSGDATAEVARAAGATVVRLGRNQGKGAAVAAGVAAASTADVYLLIDADLGTTAGLAESLLAPVLAGDADMTVAVLPSAGRRGGFGSVRRVAASGIERASGFVARAPLSGQRAVRGELLRSFVLSDRFGLEVGLTVDAVRAGARVLEVDVAMEHRHTGRRLAGFRHRAGQGVDIVRALWPRLTSARARVAVIVGLFVVASVWSLWSGGRTEPRSVAAVGGASKVVVFGVPGLSWDDVGTGRMPALDRLVAQGAVAATNVRTRSRTPSSAEGYATLGAGTRVAATTGEAAAAYDADTELEGGTAAEAMARRTGGAPAGDVVVLGSVATQKRNDGAFLTSRPGALGEALQRAGKRTAVVNNADRGTDVARPAAAALMDSTGSVDAGEVGTDLLRRDGRAPFGFRADPERVVSELDAALATADVVVVDPGDLDRAAAFAPLAATPAETAARQRALATTDALLGRVADSLPAGARLLVVSVAPPGDEWHLTPTVLVGEGVPHGYLHSPSTRRPGVITLADLAPTVLAALDVPTPDGMVGHPLRYRPGPVNVGSFAHLDRDAVYREKIYFPLTLTFIVLQALLYLVCLGSVRARLRIGASQTLRVGVLGIAAYPLATFLFRGIPNVAATGRAGIGILLVIDAVIVWLALRSNRHPLSPLSWILGATIAVLALDVATGARLQTSSLLGYSLHTASRFTGLGNTAFATLAACTVLLGAIHVAYAPRRREALLTVACLFGFVVLIDGAPTLGSDVGGILTLVPVLGLVVLVLSGRRLDGRALVVAGLVTVAVVALAAGIDVMRPASTQTHLGRLVTDVARDGPSAFTTTAGRKLAVNFRSYTSPWTWAVIVLAGGMLYVLGWTRRWTELLPKPSPLRAGVGATLAAGLLGYLVNDSGIVVAAVVFVYVGPLMTMLAVARDRERSGGYGRRVRALRSVA